MFTPTAELRRRVYRALMAETVLQRRIERARCLLRHGADDHVERVRVRGVRPIAAPEVSVVVTLYNYAHLVTETLDSIAAIDRRRLRDRRRRRPLHRRRASGRRRVRSASIPSVPTLLLGSDINRGLPAARNLGFEQRGRRR